MLSAAVYILRAQNSAALPAYHGRLTHGAFFAALQDIDPCLSNSIHDELNQKPFTVSQILPLRPHLRADETVVNKNELVEWRVTGLNDLMAECLQTLQPGYVITLNGLQLKIEKTCLTPDEHDDAGRIRKIDLIAACRSVPQVREICFNFSAPATFRSFERDYPLPLPEFVFPSLAEKWTCNDSANLLTSDKTAVRELAVKVIPRSWSGNSMVLNVKRNRPKINAFTGKFTYNLEKLTPNEQRLFLLLAQFAVFSGVGRLTGQGLGRVQIQYTV